MPHILDEITNHKESLQLIASQKYCSRCKKQKPRTPQYFVRNRAIKDGFQNYCKLCQNKIQAKTRALERMSPNPKKEKLEEIPCLKCRNLFKPQTKFNRICPQCKLHTHYSEEDYGVGLLP